MQHNLIWLAVMFLVATPFGLVYTDPQGRVRLIGERGTSEALSSPSDTPAGWHPTVQADNLSGVVAWAEPSGDGVALTFPRVDKKNAESLAAALGHVRVG